MKGAAETAKSTAEKIQSAFSGVSQKITTAFSGITGKLAPVFNTIKSLSGQVMTGLSTAFTIGATAAGVLAGAVVGVGGALAALALKAAPLEGIGMAFQTMAGNVSLSLDAMREAAAGTISDFALMRAANVALTGAGVQLGQAMGQQLPGLLEIARASARATGQDVDFLFNSLVTGIKRGSKLLIDNTGLVLNTADANQTLADSLGKTVEQLTDEEKQVALLNATIAAGQPLIARVGLDSLTTAERVAQAKASFQNLADSLGLALGPALGNAATRIYDLVNTLSGPLVGAMESRVAPAIDLVIDGLGGMVNAAVQSGGAFINQFGGAMLSAASNALSWGINITTQLATGLIQGAVSAITAAMNFIGGLLSSWLSPGSPPKVAPNVDDWGAAAFTEYLKGFTDADFSVLEGIQGPLDKALDALVDTGALGATEASNTFKGLTEDISAALDTFKDTGTVSEDLFLKLRTAGGAFGSELEDLTRKQFALAGATNAVAAADERLVAAQKAEEQANDDLTRIMDEYNALLATGASDDVLAAKRAQFDAAKRNLSTAQDEITAAEDAKAAAEEQVDPLQEQVKLQEKVLDQLFQMAEQPKEAASAMAKAAGALGKMAKLKLPTGAGAGALPSMEMPSMGGLGAGITGGLSETFTKAKDELRAKFADMFKPLTDAWEKDIKPALDGLGDAWDRFSEAIGKTYDKYIAPFIEDIKKLIPPDLITNFGRITGVVLVLAGAFTIISGIISAVGAIITFLGTPIILIIGALTLLYTAWTNNWLNIQGIVGGVVEFLSNLWTNTLLPAIETVVAFVVTTLIPAFVNFGTFVGGVVTGVLQTLSDLWTNTLLPAIEGVWAFIQTNIIPIFETVAGFVTRVLQGALRGLANLWDNILLPAITAVWNFISTSILPIFTSLVDLGIAVLDLALATLTATWENILLPALTTVWEFISASILPIFTDVSDFINAAFNDALTLLTGLWENNLQPALEGVWNVINSNILPIFKDIVEYVKNDLGNALTWLKDDIIEPLKDGFERLKEIIQKVTEKIKDLADRIRGIKIPSALQPGSPTPFEIGLLGIGSAMDLLSHTKLPSLNRELEVTASITASPDDLAGGGTRNNNTYNYFEQTVNTNATTSTVVHGYELMRSMIGA